MADKTTNSELNKEVKKYEEKVANNKYESLAQQVQAEWNICYMHQFGKINQNLARLKLYNNQRRDDDLAGDPLLFTVTQTLLSSFYDDELGVVFEGREEGDSDQASNLTDLSSFDYDKMGKNKMDYMWDWDTLFFGRGLVEMDEFNRDKAFLCPTPYVIDPMTFLHDPKATSVNGDLMGRGAMRFGGYEMYVKRDDLKAEYGYTDTAYLRADNEMRSLLKQAEQQRDDAQNLQYYFNDGVQTNLQENGVIPVLKWFTWYKGKRVKVILANSKSRVIKVFESPFQDRWSIVDRTLFPSSHSWDGTSVPDLIEDKQRQRAVAINLAIKAMKSSLYPQYMYDEDRIKNKADLLNFGFNKFIPIQNNDGRDIAGAVRPMNKADIHWEMVQYVLNTLDTAAQKSTATPDLQQGQIANQNRTLGELNLVASRVDTRYSLTAKIFGWSEKDFWQQWYRLYKEYFASDIDEKVIRVSGALGAKWRPLKRKDIITDVDPDLKVESRQVSEQKNVRERILMQGFGNALILEPTANRKYFLKRLAKLNNYKPDEVDLLIPPTPEELKAQDENVMLNDDKLPVIQPTDDHIVHLEQHAKASETPAKKAHITAHKVAIEMQRQNPELFPNLQAGQTPPAGNGQPTQAGTPSQNMNGGNPAIPTNVNPTSAVTDLMKSASAIGQ